jgi:alanyl-tRNA synthetase
MTPKKMTGAEIRQSFIDFFVEQGHTEVPSASLVPGGDATLLFTNAGMVQFKDVFIGTDKRPYTRAVDSQKCMRVAGKHNDLDDVGRDDTHHTFFEMLGNWSFGDYYKKEAIQWAWQLLTEVWGLDKSRLYTTVFKDELDEIPTDDEAAGYWQQQPGFDPTHLFYLGRAENFWEMAETGPCGPCSEIHYDLRPEEGGQVTTDTLDTERFVELWNLVFIQFNRLSPTRLEPLPATHVDTGMGFERIVSVLQEVPSNYLTDLFEKPLSVLRSLTGQTEEQMLADFTPYRVIADHTRSAAFLIADGVVPGNVGRNYVCRMIIRRAARFGGVLGLHEPFLAGIAEQVIATYGDFYPELVKNRSAILDNLTREEIRFARTVETGTSHLQTLLDELDTDRGDDQSGDESRAAVLDGRKAFDLYATYGLPLEISRDIAREQGLEVDEPGFRAAMEEHRIASGGGKAMGQMEGEDAEFFAGVFRQLQADGKLGTGGVEYDPYQSFAAEGEVLALVSNGQVLKQAGVGDQVSAIVPKTGFYIESGGQVSDTGYIRAADGSWEIEIQEIRKPSTGIISHEGEVLHGHPRVGDRAIVEVDMERRHDIMRNHTATHLLHAALHQVLGNMARQAGSLVAPDRLRFDFTHPEAMTPEQIERVERIVNSAIAADMAVMPEFKPREDALQEGVIALFGEKYGETVRTLSIAHEDQDSKYSYELCGGTHLERTSDVGVFLIISEGSAAAGIRRIEAVTGRGAYQLISNRFNILKQTAGKLKSSYEEIPLKVELLEKELSNARKEIAALRQQLAFSTFNVETIEVRMVSDIPVYAAHVTGADLDTMRLMGDQYKQKYTNGIAVFANEEGKLIVAVGENVVKQGLKAGAIISAIGGRGGGRPNMAQGSIEISKVEKALEKVYKVIDVELK